PAHEHYPRLNTVIMESTYGGVKDIQPSRKDALIQLRDIIKRTLDSKGHVLIPVFAIGRSQEVMIVIEQLVRNKEIESVPVYLDGLIYEATAIHTAYPEYLNSTLRNIIFQSGDNPFLSKIFQRVDHREKREAIMGNPEPCIVLATSGMLSGGPVMEYLKAWAEEENSTLVFVGYQAEGTIGRRIQKGWKDITYTEKGHPVTITLKMNVATCDSFSGHSDRKQLITYLQKISPRPSRVILCHGEETKTLELAAGIQKRTKYETAVMSNLETVRLK
ncbi:MAG: MBL fold metallo-hydrolase RNA specificity domain-containing protein, partial [Thermoplasmata archaeon]